MASLEESTTVDRELIERIAGGDASALAALYERMRAPLGGYLVLLVRDSGVAEEVLQDTMLAIWRGAPRFRGESSVRSWVFAIARRRAIDRLRRVNDRIDRDADLESRIDHRPGPEAIALTAFAQAELEQAIATLPRHHREVLMLLFQFELSYAELAEVLAVPMGTVKSRISHARRALRARLGEPPL
jgi:RNA polymerase sigma-70 factor (ECF subfamily)